MDEMMELVERYGEKTSKADNARKAPYSSQFSKAVDEQEEAKAKIQAISDRQDRLLKGLKRVESLLDSTEMSVTHYQFVKDLIDGWEG